MLFYQLTTVNTQFMGNVDPYKKRIDSDDDKKRKTKRTVHVRICKNPVEKTVYWLTNDYKHPPCNGQIVAQNRLIHKFGTRRKGPY